MKKITLLLLILPLMLSGQAIDLQTGTDTSKGVDGLFGNYYCSATPDIYYDNQILEYTVQTNGQGLLAINGSIEWIDANTVFDLPSGAGVICPNTAGLNVLGLATVRILLRNGDDEIVDEIVLQYTNTYGTGTINYNKILGENQNNTTYKLQIYVTRSTVDLGDPYAPANINGWFGVYRIEGEFKFDNSDYLGLMALYNSTNGANWTNKWDVETPYNTWDNIGFNELNEVRVLFLSGNNLNGTVPKEIKNFKSITQLDFYNNSLSGNIPEEIGEIKTLESAFFDRNNLSGSIPNSILNLTNLTFIYFNNNNPLCILNNAYFNIVNVSTIYKLVDILNGC